MLLEVEDWFFLDISNEMRPSFPTGRMLTMKLDVSCFLDGMVINKIVHIDKFEDTDKVEKSRNLFCTVVNRKVLIYP